MDAKLQHLQTKTIPMNLIWCESALWLQSSSIRKIPGILITPMDMPMCARWENDLEWLCTSTGQDSTNGFDLDWICQVIDGEYGQQTKFKLRN